MSKNIRDTMIDFPYQMKPIDHRKILTFFIWKICFRAGRIVIIAEENFENKGSIMCNSSAGEGGTVHAHQVKNHQKTSGDNF